MSNEIKWNLTDEELVYLINKWEKIGESGSSNIKHCLNRFRDLKDLVCPFCNSKSIELRIDTPVDKHFECQECYAQGPHEDNKKDAAKWAKPRETYAVTKHDFVFFDYSAGIEKNIILKEGDKIYIERGGLK